MRSYRIRLLIPRDWENGFLFYRTSTRDENLLNTIETIHQFQELHKQFETIVQRCDALFQAKKEKGLDEVNAYTSE